MSAIKQTSVSVPSLPPVDVSTWEELYAFTSLGDRLKDAQWLMSFGNRVKSCCAARNKWQLALMVHPVDWDHFQQWAINLHASDPALLEEKKDTVQSPTAVELAGNFAGAMAKWTAAGFPTLTQAQYDERKAVCDACPQWDATAYLGLGKCKACGCTRFKRWLFTEKCKLDLWPALTSAPAA
jgi:hypothetical protein